MAQLIKRLAAKQDFLSSISGTHMVKETPESCPLMPYVSAVSTHMCTHDHTHTVLMVFVKM